MQPILKINLTTETVTQFEVPHDWEEQYLGGASLAARLLYTYLTPDLEPLSPQAPILFMNGPLSGTAGPAVGRFVVCARSPATRLWGESHCGGFWGPELRMAGYIGLWLEGRAEQPVYLWIRDGKVEIRPAGHLWGLDTYVTQEAVARELDAAKTRIMVIGPAGERMEHNALLLTDHGRVAGRTGLGAVLGSKNVKAVAVKGSGYVPVVDAGSYQALRTAANRELREGSVAQVMRELGTASAGDYFDYLSEMPKRYFHQSVFSGASAISGSNIHDSLLVGVSTCHGCVIACGRVVSLPEAPKGERGARRKGAEYETLVGFGPNLLIDDTIFITRMGELCDRYGMDSISLTNTIGLAIHLFQAGRITPEDTGGLSLAWGDKRVVEELVHLAGKGDGFGSALNEGALTLGQRFGAEDEAVQVKGLEAAYHDPRGASGMALVYATSPVGASHNQSDYFLADIGQVEESLGLEYFSNLGGAEKARNVAIHQDWRTATNSLVMCIFSNISPEAVLSLVNSACGLEWSLADLLRCGERGWNLKRMINHRLGLERAADALPKTMLQPYEDAAEGEAGYVPDFEAMLEAYYHARGWDPVTGRPKPEKLAELGLSWVNLEEI